MVLCFVFIHFKPNRHPLLNGRLTRPELERVFLTFCADMNLETSAAFPKKISIRNMTSQLETVRHNWKNYVVN
jgi:hypothetical protein